MAVSALSSACDVHLDTVETGQAFSRLLLGNDLLDASPRQAPMPEVVMLRFLHHVGENDQHLPVALIGSEHALRQLEGVKNLGLHVLLGLPGWRACLAFALRGRAGSPLTYQDGFGVLDQLLPELTELPVVRRSLSVKGLYL